MHLRCITWRFYGLLWLLISLPFAQQAAPLSPVVQNVIEQQQKMLLDEGRKQRELLQNSQLTPELNAAAPMADNGDCHSVVRISLTDSRVLPASVRRQLMQLPANNCMTLRDINQRVRDVSQAYLTRGYITSRAWLPEQDISSGVLNIAVMEGKIESITLDGVQDSAINMAFPDSKDRVLNLRDIEQGLEQLNRLASRQLTVDIHPGTRSGYSRVELIPVDSRFPASLDIGFDNRGQKSTGTGQMSASLTIDNVLRLADRWSLNAGHDSEFRHDRRSRSLSGGVTIPYGYWLFGAQYDWSDSFQTLGMTDPAVKWRYQGMVQSQRLTLGRTLYRDGLQRLAMDTSFTRKKTENRLADVRLDVSSPDLTVFTAGFNYSRSVAGGYLTFGPMLAKGLHITGATADRPGYSSLPVSEFRRYSMSASWYYPLAPSVYWLTSAYGQTSPDNLYSSERVSVGGQYSVRGFKEQYLSGNRGGYLRNELNWRMGDIPHAGTLSLTGAVDTGHVSTQKNQVDGGSLTGAALGIELEGRWFSHSLTLGVPLYWPDSLHPDKQVVYWQATVSL